MFTTDDLVPSSGQPGPDKLPVVIEPSSQAPVVTITGPVSGITVPIDTPVQFTGTFTDDAGTHTALWRFDADSVAGIVVESGGTVSATWSFASPGVYSVTLTVRDQSGNSGTASTVDGQNASVVVFAQDAGFASGSGRITSPAGALVADPLHTGRADFTFDSKYHKLETTPRGTTTFALKWTSYDFQSTGYDWIVALPAGARFQGSGTVNGAGDFAFTLWAVDGDDVGGPDRLRIRIRNKATGTVVYDTQMGAPDNAEPATAIDSGNISVRLPNGGLGHLSVRAPAVEPAAPGMARGFSLEQNSPNPFRASTLVRFTLPQRSHVRLSVFDVAGREIATLANGAWEAGSHSVRWTGMTDSGERARRGVYFVHMASGREYQSVRKMIVLD
jgi:PKD repeat protein